MTLAKRLAETKPSRTGKPCGVETLLSVLTADDRKALIAAMAVPRTDPARLSSQQIADVLNSEGHSIGYKSIESHRKGACRCEPRE